MTLCEHNKCTGCAACVNTCVNSAIHMCSDDEGFLYPIIEPHLCIECGCCADVCPQGKNLEIFHDFEKVVFACWHKNKRILKSSTSGGVFSALAEAVLSQDGVVYGAGFGSNLEVMHKRITSSLQLSDLRGSKYVQSKIGHMYTQAEEDLKQGKKVLFTGTPCQIDGLYHYLGKKFAGQLYTADLVCHGVPSPKIYEDYLGWMAEKYGASVKSICFRDKKPGWYVYGMKIVFKNGQEYENDNWHDPYHRGFLRNYFIRESCYQCHYTNTNRPADITLADDWGYKETGFKDRDNDQGVSMVMINSENGKSLFDTASIMLHVFPRSLDNAINANQALRKPFERPNSRNEFWADYKNLPFDALLKKYCYSEEIPEWLRTRREQIISLRHKRAKQFPKRFAKSLLGKERYDTIKKVIKHNKSNN